MMRGLLVVGLLAGLAPRTALGGTCVVQPGGATLVAQVPSAGPFSFSSVDAFTLGVDVDATHGTFTLHRDGVPQIDIGTDGGPVKLLLAGPDAVGTIDAGGNITLPRVAYEELFESEHLPASPTLTTGRYSVQLNGVDYPGHGAPLDFTSGVFRLEGAEILANAPIVHETVVSGLSLSCELTPIPDRAALPKAATLKAVGGTGRVGKGSAGDTLKLHAVLEPGAASFDFAHQDVFVAIEGATGEDLVVVFVRAGGLNAHGRRFTVHDRDGTVLAVLAGRKGGNDAAAPTSGALAVAAGRRSPLKVRVSGVDLAGLSGRVTVSVGVGPSVAAAGVAVSGAGRTRRLH